MSEAVPITMYQRHMKLRDEFQDELRGVHLEAPQLVPKAKANGSTLRANQ